MSDTTVWVLRPNDDRETDPWDPWYDKCFTMVVRAETEREAREVAQSEGECETARSGGEVWTDPELATCVPINEYDPEREGKYATDGRVLVRDVQHA